MKIMPLLGIILLTLTLIILNSCGNDSTTASATSGNSYAGPGSNYSATLYSDGTFSIAEADAGWTATGTYTTLASGFKKLTVTAVTGGSGPSPGDSAYMLDIPGVVALLKPIGAGTQIIGMVKAGACPSANFSANWINTNKYIDITDNTRDTYGTFSYVHATTSGTLPSKYAFDGTSLGSNDLGTLTCSSGIATIDGAKMYLTQVGGAIVHTNSGTPGDSSDDDFIFAMSSSSIASIAALNDTYVGLFFQQSGGAGSGDVKPVYLDLSGGAGTGAEITDVDNNTISLDTAAITISSVNSPSAGFAQGTIATTGAPQPMHCMANVDVQSSGKNLIFCVGASPGDSTKLYSLVLISK